MTTFYLIESKRIQKTNCQVFQNTEVDELAREQVGQWPGLMKELCVKCCRFRTQQRQRWERKDTTEWLKTGCKWKDDAIMKGEMEQIEEKKIHVHLEMKAYVESGIVN